MNAKKVFGLLFFSSAFTKRNISSVLLVGVFFVVFILAGGKIDTQPLPKMNSQGGFGAAEVGQGDFLNPPQVSKSKGPRSSLETLGLVPSEERHRRETSDQTKGRLFSNKEADESLNKPLDRSGLIQGQKKVYLSERERKAVERSERYQRKEVDPLDAIQERLKRLK